MSIDPIEDPTKPTGHIHPDLKTSSPSKKNVKEMKDEFGAQAIDPAGTWAKFLSAAGGEKATPEEVKLFLQGFEKALGVLVQQNQAAFERSKRRLKNAQEGREGDEF